jgi:hypothetical protein
MGVKCALQTQTAAVIVRRLMRGKMRCVVIPVVRTVVRLVRAWAGRALPIWAGPQTPHDLP